ncbi:unnamed protein product [Somion occarium]|uniref:F-box domain-containing protein n=1 Tax=Somion occarium TaxID=3059160 RepID=A0ABP1DPN0_9APHY
MAALDGTGEKLDTTLAASIPPGGSGHSFHVQDPKTAKRIHTEKRECSHNSEYVQKESSPPSRKRPLEELKLDADSSHKPDGITQESKHAAAVDGESSSLGADDARPAKRTRLGETASLDNPEECNARVLLLPIELLDLILEQLWERPNIKCLYSDTLWACARTCSRWYAAARPHIFRSISIENEKSLHKLAKLVRGDSNIASWMHKVCINGGSLKDEDFPERLKGVEKDQDCWIYQFPSVFDVTPLNIKIVELMHFAHLSPRREDQEAFARWIPHLSELQSVQHLHLFRCQMSSNAMAAVVRALPRLSTVFFCESDFTAPNITCLCDESSGEDHASPAALIESSVTPEPARPPETKSALAPVESVPNSSVVSSHTSHDDPEAPVQIPLINPSPALQFFAMGNDETLYPYFEFGTLRNMLEPKVLSRSLKSLHLGNEYEQISLSEFLADLGPAPALEYLKIYIVDDLESTIEVGKQVSNLRNLKTLQLRTPLLDHDQSDIVRQFLTFLDSPHLKTLTITVPTQDPVGNPKVLDEYLASDKFKDLNKFSIEFMDDLRLYGTQDEMEAAAQAMFPLMAKRGILCVEDCETLYPYWTYF